MSSPPVLVAWQQKYATDIRQVASDLKLAQQKLVLATVHVGRAKELLRRNEYDLALNSAENALVVSCDAVLRKDGFEVRSHVARFAYPLKQNAGLLNRIRTARNAAQYEAPGVVSSELASQAIALADQALSEVAKVVS
jgi:uncharacterized protein (UPF0332 family)